MLLLLLQIEGDTLYTDGEFIPYTPPKELSLTPPFSASQLPVLNNSTAPPAPTTDRYRIDDVQIRHLTPLR